LRQISYVTPLWQGGSKLTIAILIDSSLPGAVGIGTVDGYT